jgi:hydrogenase 3 maturation protease
MTWLNKCLGEYLKGRVLIVGIGNTFRGDDGAGPALIKRLGNSLRVGIQSSDQAPACQLSIMDVGEVPENFLGKMIECKPDTILFVDVADFGAPAGSINLIDAGDLSAGGFSTHSSSISLVIDYLGRETQAELLLLGIQPERLEMGDGLSRSVEKAIQKIEELVTNA